MLNIERREEDWEGFSYLTDPNPFGCDLLAAQNSLPQSKQQRPPIE
jgi:hypothetical protein